MLLGFYILYQFLSMLMTFVTFHLPFDMLSKTPL